MEKKKKTQYFTKIKSSTERSKKSENACREAILNTLEYRAVFNYPLSFYQLAAFLISKNSYSREQLESELKALVRSKKVRALRGKYYLSKVRPVSWQGRLNSTQVLLSQGRATLHFLKVLPWIQFIGVTGAVAAYNAPKKDDIDIFIITKAQRIWLTRFFVVVILKTLGKYRTDNDPSGKICPNIYVDETKLEWEKANQNLYVAHEILMTQPIFDRNNTYFRFINQNKWVFEHFSNYKMRYPRFSKIEMPKSGLINGLERVFMRIQLNYMAKKKTHEITTKHLIHFNREDNTHKVLSSYTKNIDNCHSTY